MTKGKTVIGKVRAKFVELYSRIIKVDENKDGSVYWNGENNLYPNEIERVILNSPTASRASKVMAKFIAGLGVVGNNEIVNPERNIKLTDLIKAGAHDISKQNGVFFHVGYYLDEELMLRPSLSVLDYNKVRKAKEDDNGYDTKFIYKDYSEVKGFGAKKEEEIWYYPFSKDENVTIEQIKADYFEENDDENATLADMLPYYRGQVFYLNLTPQYKYALSPFDSVYNDMDFEFRIGMYLNRQVRCGFLGKTYVVASGFDEEDEKRLAEDMSKWLGSDNVGGVHFMSVPQGVDIDKAFKVGQVKAELDEKMFEKTIINSRDNILGAANNIPSQLVKSDNTLFGVNSDSYIEMKKFYTEQTEEERSSLEQAITYLGYPCKIKPITQEEVEDESTGEVVSDETKAAQATLRGSVGGVQGILAIQQSFANGLTDYQSALTILVEIYGFTPEVSDALLGSPEKVEENEPTTAAV